MEQTCSWVVASILGLGAIAACGDGQAPSNYRGEPLMSLNGVVTSSQSTLSQHLVPAFVFVDGPTAETVDQAATFVRVDHDSEIAFRASNAKYVTAPPPSGKAVPMTADAERSVPENCSNSSRRCLSC